VFVGGVALLEEVGVASLCFVVLCLLRGKLVGR